MHWHAYLIPEVNLWELVLLGLEFMKSGSAEREFTLSTILPALLRGSLKLVYSQNETNKTQGWREMAQQLRALPVS